MQLHLHTAQVHEQHAVIAEQLAAAVNAARGSRVRARQLRELAERRRGGIAREYGLAQRALTRLGQLSGGPSAH